MNKLLGRIDGTSVAIFRIGFGLLLLWELFYFLRIDFVKVFLVDPKIQFTYQYLSFLKPLPKPLLDILIFVLIACCVLIILGRFYKKAMIVFCLGFTYFFLLDKAYYNNHLYLICLILFLMILIPADSRLSFSKKGAQEKKPTYYYHILILRLQLVIVYFFGGIAKLNMDWLVSQEPVRTMLGAKGAKSFLGDLLTNDVAVYFFTYGGLAFDLIIPFLLLIPRTRIFAVFCALIFNMMNAWLFEDINIFPYFMMLSLILFLDTEKVGRFVRKKLFGKKSAAHFSSEKGVLAKPLFVFLGIFFLIQLLVPFRHLMYKGNVDWTGQGQRFAWRMKIQHRQLEHMEFKVWDLKTKTIYPVEFGVYGLNQDQINVIAYDPSAVVQFAKFLKKHCKENKGMDEVYVKSKLIVSFNGRPAQPIFGEDVDLASIGDSPSQLLKYIKPLVKNN